MFYLFMALWIIASVATVVMLVSWVVSKATKKDSKKKGKAALYLFASSIVLLIVGIAFNNNNPAPNSNLVADATEKDERIARTEAHDFMLFEIGFYEIANTISFNEKVYEDVIKNIEKYNVVDAYDQIKDYKETLMPNATVVKNLKVNDSLSDETKNELNKIKTNISHVLVGNSGALDSLLKYIDTGSVKELSTFKEQFLMMGTYVDDQKKSLTSIRKKLNIAKPEYEIVYHPENTDTFYVQTSDTSKESVFKIVHDIKTTVDSDMSMLWVYNSDAKVKKGERPEESVKYDLEYISKEKAFNSYDGKKTYLTEIFK